jgi:hypothetical protein
MVDYRPRSVEAELDALLSAVSAIALEGPKGVGKTATASRRARTILSLDVPAQRALLEADPDRLHRLEEPILLDEWQRYPPSWDLVRRAVDADPRPGRFLLTGSTLPRELPAHSGAGRIVTVRMRPLSLAERHLQEPTVSLEALLAGKRPRITGHSTVALPAYLEELVSSGFPGIRFAGKAGARALLDGYLDQIAKRELPELGHVVRRPATLRAWLAAYAAATATSTSYNVLLDAASPGENDKPSKTTTIAYREALTALWLLDPAPAWTPLRNAFTRLGQAPKHHLVDPALAARLLGTSAASLSAGDDAGPPRLRDGNLTGRLFESLVTLSVRVYAQASAARVHHLRTHNGAREIDLIVERDDGRVLAVEVKLGGAVGDEDVSHLLALQRTLGPDLLDAVVVTAGSDAYRRTDGVAVVPAALLGP